jgi:hypothetical protein
MTPTPTIKLTDRNECKFLMARKVVLTPTPRDTNNLDFEVGATEEVFQLRREYALNGVVSVLDFISASKEIDRLIYDHRQGYAGGAR